MPCTNFSSNHKQTMKKTKQTISEHKLVNSEREAEAAMILFACILGGVILILLAIAMG